MSETKFYTLATSHLATDSCEALERVLAWLRAVARLETTQTHRIAENIKNEWNLIGEPPTLDGEAYASFLTKVASVDSVTAQDRLGSFDNICAEFRFQGRSVDTSEFSMISGPMFRYVQNGAVRAWAEAFGAAHLVERLDNSPHQAFSELIELLEDFPEIKNQCFLAASGRYAWATFDDPRQPFENPSNAARNDPTVMAANLALRRENQRYSILVELVYERVHASGSRYPTVADAAAEHRFAPANPEEHPWGRTAPENGISQPEILHANQPLTTLARLPRLLGRIEGFH